MTGDTFFYFYFDPVNLPKHGLTFGLGASETER